MTQTPNATPNQKLEGKAFTDETRKRQWIFTQPPREVRMSIYSMPSFGAERRERDEEAQKARLLAQAEERGLNPHAYRGDKGQIDTGFEVLHKEKRTRVDRLVRDLEENGLVPTKVFEDVVKGKVRTTIVFGLPSPANKEVQVPGELRRALRATRWTSTIWANPKKDEGGFTYRQDTVNLFPDWDKDNRSPERDIRMVGNTYRAQ